MFFRSQNEMCLCVFDILFEIFLLALYMLYGFF